MNLDNIYITKVHANKIKRLNIKDEVLKVMNYFIECENRFHKYDVASCRAIVLTFNNDKCCVNRMFNNEYGMYRVPCDFGIMSIDRGGILFKEWPISIYLMSNECNMMVEFTNCIPDLEYIKASEIEKFCE